MCSTVPSATESNLNDPTLGRAFGRIIKNSLLIKAKEDHLDDILGLTAVIKDPLSNSENEPRILGEERVQSLLILGLEPSHEFFVTGRTNLNGLRR
jgi:hypothetical protein